MEHACKHAPKFKVYIAIHSQSEVDSENLTKQRWKFVISANYFEIMTQNRRLFQVSPVIHTKWGWISEHLSKNDLKNFCNYAFISVLGIYSYSHVIGKG